MASSARRFLFVLASARRRGNSEQLAAHAAEHLPAGATAEWLSLLDHPLPPFEDLRHGAAYPAPTGHARRLMEATLAATDLVLVTPLYWYTLSAPAKLYLDHWSAWMRVPEVGFRAGMAGKTLWAVVASSGPAAEAQPLRDTLRLCADYLGMTWGGLLLGNGSRPGDVLRDADALAQARTFWR